ncbi:MAG TPA: hypothetical protein VHI13_19115 [Candidatus Kapabacteria bacterium]|nr:hypothetical protein [Candidatus Kapabacteria bacterium]
MNRVSRVALLVAFAALVAPLAVHAQNDALLTGRWTITDGRYGGSRYDGFVDITPGKLIYNLAWNAAGKTYKGFGVEQDRMLYCAWGNANFGFVLYTIVNDSTVNGVWANSGSPEDQGAEYLVGGSISAKATEFRVAGTNPPSNGSSSGSGYSGTLKVSHDGDMYSFEWHVNQDVYYGVGIRCGKQIAVGWGSASDDFGAICYTEAPDVLRGRWVAHSGAEIGAENLQRMKTGQPGR